MSKSCLLYTSSVGFSSFADELQIKHLVSHIEFLNDQLEEIDKKIEEFSITNNSPILSIPGISHFSGTCLLYTSFSNIRGNIITYDFENAGKSMNVTLKVTHEFNENYWVKEPTIAAYNLLEEPQPKAEAKYGKVEFKYSKDNETFDSKKPNSAGTWYMKAYVEAGESYGGLESESKKFEVKKANGSATVEIEGWSEGEKPNSPVIKTEVYKPEEIHVSYKNNDTGEISSLPPTAVSYTHLDVYKRQS